MAMREPLEMLVQILVNGGRVEQHGYEYAMAEDGALCVLMHNQEGAEVPVKVDCDLINLKRMADSIGRNELWLKCCGLKMLSVSGS